MNADLSMLNDRTGSLALCTRLSMNVPWRFWPDASAPHEYLAAAYAHLGQADRALDVLNGLVAALLAVPVLGFLLSPVLRERRW